MKRKTVEIKLLNSAVLSVALLLVTVSFLTFPVFAARQNDHPGAEGTEKPLYRQTDQKTGNACYVFAEYVLKTVVSEDVGEEIRVYKRSGATNFKKSCADDRRTPYMTVENSDANFFFGLTGDKFLIDSGTSAGIRGLDIVDLKSKKIIYSTEYKETVKVSGNYLIYNKPSQIKGSLKNCPQAAKWKKQGGGIEWVQLTRLDLTTLKTSPAGKLVCSYVE